MTTCMLSSPLQMLILEVSPFQASWYQQVRFGSTFRVFLAGYPLPYTVNNWRDRTVANVLRSPQCQYWHRWQGIPDLPRFSLFSPLSMTYSVSWKSLFSQPSSSILVRLARGNPGKITREEKGPLKIIHEQKEQNFEHWWRFLASHSSCHCTVYLKINGQRERRYK